MGGTILRASGLLMPEDSQHLPVMDDQGKILRYQPLSALEACEYALADRFEFALTGASIAQLGNFSPAVMQCPWSEVNLDTAITTDDFEDEESTEYVINKTYYQNSSRNAAYECYGPKTFTDLIETKNGGFYSNYRTAHFGFGYEFTLRGLIYVQSYTCEPFDPICPGSGGIAYWTMGFGVSVDLDICFGLTASFGWCYSGWWPHEYDHMMDDCFDYCPMPDDVLLERNTENYCDIGPVMFSSITPPRKFGEGVAEGFATGNVQVKWHGRI
jgi:hypothetical protein